MKINFSIRFKNKQWLVTFVTTVVAFGYQILGMFEVVPKVSEDQITNLATMIINLLAVVGVIIDPTTKGVKDSDRAMNYVKPSEVKPVKTENLVLKRDDI